MVASSVLIGLGGIAVAQDAAPSGPGAAAEPTVELEALITDRPDFTESTDTIPTGHVQVEGGYTYSREGADKQQSVGELLVRVSTGKSSELRIEVPSYLRDDVGGVRTSGWDDALVGAKFNLSHGGGGFGLKKPALAVLVGTTLPTGSRAVATRKLQPEVKLAAAVDLSEKWALSSNVGYVRGHDGTARFGQWLGSLSLACGLSEKVGAYFEVFGMTRTDATGGSDRKYFNTGLTYLASNDRQFDIRYGAGLGNNVGGSDYFFGFGAAQRF